MYMIMIVLTQCCFSVTYMLLQCLLIFRISLYLYISKVSILCAFVILITFVVLFQF